MNRGNSRTSGHSLLYRSTRELLACKQWLKYIGVLIFEWRWREGSVFATAVAAWLSGNIVGRINEVTLRRARLVLGWVTVFDG